MAKLMRNKRGWIRIVEAFVAVLLITGIILIVLDKGYIEKQDNSDKIYEIENSLLREIQNNDSLRQEILSFEELPINWAEIPESIKTKIQNYNSYLECEAKICSMDNPCLFDLETEKNIYAKSIAITANNSEYNPRQLKLFCWLKEV